MIPILILPQMQKLHVFLQITRVNIIGEYGNAWNNRGCKGNLARESDFLLGKRLKKGFEREPSKTSKNEPLQLKNGSELVRARLKCFIWIHCPVHLKDNLLPLMSCIQTLLKILMRLPFHSKNSQRHASSKTRLGIQVMIPLFLQVHWVSNKKKKYFTWTLTTQDDGWTQKRKLWTQDAHLFSHWIITIHASGYTTRCFGRGKMHLH